MSLVQSSYKPDAVRFGKMYVSLNHNQPPPAPVIAMMYSFLQSYFTPEPISRQILILSFLDNILIITDDKTNKSELLLG